jgi:hypothetical protein
MIEDIMREFDFKRSTISAMDHLNWQWVEKVCPTIESLENKQSVYFVEQWNLV